MNAKYALLRHFLAALAYRFQKALRDAPPEFAAFETGGGVYQLVSNYGLRSSA